MDPRNIDQHRRARHRRVMALFDLWRQIEDLATNFWIIDELALSPDRQGRPRLAVPIQERQGPLGANRRDEPAARVANPQTELGGVYNRTAAAQGQERSAVLIYIGKDHWCLIRERTVDRGPNVGWHVVRRLGGHLERILLVDSRNQIALKPKGQRTVVRCGAQPGKFRVYPDLLAQVLGK